MVEKQLNGLITQHFVPTAMLGFGQEDNNDKKENSTAYVTSNSFGQVYLTDQVCPFMGGMRMIGFSGQGLNGGRLREGVWCLLWVFVIPSFSRTSD